MKDFTALIRDTLASKNPIGSWQNARNILLTKGHGSVSNEDGLKFQYLVNGTVIGFIATNSHVIYFHKNDTGTDEIGVVNTNNDTPIYQIVLKDNQLNFNLNCPIEGIFIYNYKGDLIISWCDGVKSNSNPPKVLNTTTLPFAINGDGTLVDPTKFSIINLTPAIKQGSLDISYLTGGTLPGYAMYITIAYVYNDKSVTSYFPSSDIAYLGLKANPVIKKGVRLNFTNLDTNFTKLKIGIVLKLEEDSEGSSSLTGYESADLSYTGNALSVDITSLGNFTETAADAILIEQAIFTKVNTMTKYENQAIVANVETAETFNFQKYANMINIVPVEYIDTVLELTDNPKGQDASLMPDEVYAFYIELHLLNGSYTDAFHIPGRVAEGTETDVLTAGQISQYDLAWTSGEAGMKQFHVINNGIAKGVPQPSVGTTINPVPADESGNKMGYWENTEVYPNNDEYNSTIDYDATGLGGIDLRGTPVRYHRLPSIKSMYDGTLGTDGNTLVNLWFNLWGMCSQAVEDTSFQRQRRLGIKLTNIADIIPAEVLTKIQGYRISHVARNSGNSYVVGNWATTRRKDIDDGHTLVNSDGFFENYDFNVYTQDSPMTDFERVRILGNELFKFRPSLTPTYVQVNYSFYVPNPDLPPDLLNSSVDITDLERYSKCYTPLIYRPENSIANNTEHHEEGINLDLKVGLFSRDTSDFDVPDGGNVFAPYPYVQYMALNLTAYNHTLNLYTGFNSSDLNIVGRTDTIANNTVIKGGDNFTETELNINLRSRVYVQNPTYAGGGDPTYIQVRRSIAWYVRGLNSPTNCTQLFNTPPLLIDETDPAVLDLGDYDFDVLGKSGLSSIQNLLTLFTFDVGSDFINKFPFRVYRGLKIPNENLSASALSSFLITDYYEMPNDKGEIIAVRGKERALFIQHRHTLFVAAIKDKLKTTDTDAYLGRSELFSRPPEELLSDDKGYIGSTSKFACIIIKGMYITINQVNGQIFIIKEDVKEISNKGNKNWFWNNWDNGLSFYDTDDVGEKRRIDNPFISVGHLVGYDKEYNRLLFIKKMFKFIGNPTGTTFDGEFYTRSGAKLEFTDTNEFENLSKTLSFNLESSRLSWICEHDYFPNIIFYTSNGLYSLTNKLLGTNRASTYEHNDKLTKGLYYGNKFDSYIDLIFNTNLKQSKSYQNISWITDVINNSGGYEKFKTITHIMLYSNDQCSGIINIKDEHFNLTRGIEGDWNFNEFRDLVINPINPIIDTNGDLIQSNINLLTLWFEKSDFISKFITVRLIIDNVDNDTVHIHEVNVQSLISNR